MSSRTWVCHGNLLNLLLAHISPDRRYGKHHYGTRAADNDGVEVCGLVDRGPLEVAQRLFEEERGGGDAGHRGCILSSRK
jgi:hypothetical protein